MDAEGITSEVLSCVPFITYPKVDADRGLAVAQVLNDFAAAFVARKPDRFDGMASVPLQAPDGAARRP